MVGMYGIVEVLHQHVRMCMVQTIDSDKQQRSMTGLCGKWGSERAQTRHGITSSIHDVLGCMSCVEFKNRTVGSVRGRCKSSHTGPLS